MVLHCAATPNNINNNNNNGKCEPFGLKPFWLKHQWLKDSIILCLTPFVRARPLCVPSPICARQAADVVPRRVRCFSFTFYPFTFAFYPIVLEAQTSS